MILDVDYAVMCQAAKEFLDTLWVPNIGDFAIDENGEVGIITNRDKQEIGHDDDIPTKVVYVGVSYAHNNRLWHSQNPVWLPRFDQLIVLADARYALIADMQSELSNIMHARFKKYWDSNIKQWITWPPQK